MKTFKDFLGESQLTDDKTFKAVSAPDKNGLKFLVYKTSDGRESYPVGFYEDAIKDEKSFVRDLRKILEK